jgi:hypothetical protein
MQSKSADGKRPRISVSLDPEDYDWIESLSGESESMSYKLSRVVKAARMAGIELSDAKTGGAFQEFADFLATKKRSKHAQELHELLAEFLKS